MPRRCQATNARGGPCAQRPVSDRPYCFWHDPELEQERRDAVRLGGQNHRREQTLTTIYDLEGIDDLDEIRRYMQIAQMGNLALDNSVQRNRSIVAGAMALLQLYEKTVLAKQLQQVETVVDQRKPQEEPRKKRWGII